VANISCFSLWMPSPSPIKHPYQSQAAASHACITIITIITINMENISTAYISNADISIANIAIDDISIDNISVTNISITNILPPLSIYSSILCITIINTSSAMVVLPPGLSLSLYLLLLSGWQ
jgi:hypothetical protein